MRALTRAMSAESFMFEASSKRWPGGHHNLDIIAAHCGYDLKNHHHALADAEACAWIAREIL